jgi:hypothetical protein
MSALSDRRQHTIAVAASGVVDLQKKHAKFEAQYAGHIALTKTFWQRAFEIMEAKHWNSAVFCEKTLLDEKIYSRAKTNHNSNPDTRTIIAICVGLDLDISLTAELLFLAGHALCNSLEHQAYIFIITEYQGQTIHERNAFLKTFNLEPLGSKQRH